jgi:hypothetical protein
MHMSLTRCLAPVLVLAALAACTTGASAPPAATGPGSPPFDTVSRTTEQGGRFVALVGPRNQHAEPFLGVPGTNIYALRSWIDTRSGETAHQLYVSESYAGAERNWNAARDAQGQNLRFVEISKNEITCERGCSYVEEFAAALPEARLRESAGGLTVAFSAKSGDNKTIAVPGDLVQKQLTAVDEARAALPKVTAAAR